jgi:hypothetical protein
MLSTLVYVLVALCVVAIVLYVANMVLDQLHLPQPVRAIVHLVLGLVLLLVILRTLGVVGV